MVVAVLIIAVAFTAKTECKLRMFRTCPSANRTFMAHTASEGFRSFIIAFLVLMFSVHFTRINPLGLPGKHKEDKEVGKCRKDCNGCKDTRYISKRIICHKCSDNNINKIKCINKGQPLHSYRNNKEQEHFRFRICAEGGRPADPEPV